MCWLEFEREAWGVLGEDFAVFTAGRKKTRRRYFMREEKLCLFDICDCKVEAGKYIVDEIQKRRMSD